MSLVLVTLTEAYLKPCQTSVMELFAKIINDEKLLNTFAKGFILNICRDPNYPRPIYD